MHVIVSSKVVVIMISGKDGVEAQQIGIETYSSTYSKLCIH